MTAPVLEALERARQAWARSQPQLPLDLYPDDHAVLSERPGAISPPLGALAEGGTRSGRPHESAAGRARERAASRAALNISGGAV